MVNRPKHIGFDNFLLPARGVNGQYPNESLVFSTVRPEITHVARVTNATASLQYFARSTYFLVSCVYTEHHLVFPPAVSKQIQNVFEDEELQENATISKMEIVQLEGNREVSREVTHYNLEMLIALAFCFSAFIVRTTWFFQEC